jgi:hypothetical protein
MGSRTADGDDAMLDMLTSRISNMESLLGRMAASTVRNDNFRKEDPTEFSGLLHCGRNIDVRKSYDYCASDKPSMYNIVINDGECMLPEEHYGKWTTRGGELDALLCRAWGEATLADVRSKCALLQDSGRDITCADVGLPTDGHADLSSHIYETALKTKIPELVAVGTGGCIVRGRSNSTIAELLAIVIDISSALEYAEDFVCLVELERVPAYDGLVAAIARRNPSAMQSEYDALSKNAKAHAQKYEFCHDCGIVWR